METQPIIATVERVESGWLVLVDGEPYRLHDERSCDYAMQNAHEEARKINLENSDVEQRQLDGIDA